VSQARLFSARVPDGLVYHGDFLTPSEEASFLLRIRGLPFEHLEMHGVVARRRVIHFGMGYDYGRRAPTQGDPIPRWLLPLRRRVADRTAVPDASWQEILVTEYPPGAPIGWHRDAPGFGKIAGISLGSSCRLRFRRGGAGAREMREITLEPRSLYVLTGPARSAWEHSIPPVSEVRYSITLRTLA
jgi:alkylated DNA repair dioxygenase AlkB